LKPESVSTKQERIAKLAAENPAMAFTSLNHYLDAEWLRYGLQLRLLMPTSGILRMRAGTFLCFAVFATFRGATRALTLLALLARSTTSSLSTFLFVLSHNLWCPLRNSAVSE